MPVARRFGPCHQPESAATIRKVTRVSSRRLADLVLVTISLAFLAVYAWLVLAQPTGLARQIGNRALDAIWLVFVVEYLTRLWTAERRARWFLTHLHEFAVVALPMFRPLRALRLLTLIGVIHRTLGGTLRGRVVIYTVGSTILLVLVASLAMLDTERYAPAATITTFPDALWWAMETVTTVGYGDRTPVTTDGHLIAVALMVGGIALLGIVTATFASWLVDQISEQDDASQQVTRAHIDGLTAEIAQLRDEVRRLREWTPESLREVTVPGPKTDIAGQEQ